jgi:hypothetical protein
MGYGRWTPAYFHREAIELWRIFHNDKPCYGAEFVEVGKRHYVRTLDTQDKVIEVYEVLINGKLARKKKWLPDIEAAPPAVCIDSSGAWLGLWRRACARCGDNPAGRLILILTVLPLTPSRG